MNSFFFQFTCHHQPYLKLLAETILMILNIDISKTRQISTWSVEARVRNNRVNDTVLRYLPNLSSLQINNDICLILPPHNGSYTIYTTNCWQWGRHRQCTDCPDINSLALCPSCISLGTRHPWPQVKFGPMHGGESQTILHCHQMSGGFFGH